MNRQNFKSLLLTFIVIIVAVALVVSLGRHEEDCSLVEQQQDRSIAIHIRAYGSDQYLWISADGEYTHVWVSQNNNRSRWIYRGVLGADEWGRVANAIPSSFFEREAEFYLEKVQSGVAHEAFNATFSIRDGTRGRTLIVHPYHYSHGDLRELTSLVRGQVNNVEEMQDISPAILLAASRGEPVTAVPDSVRGLLEEAAGTPFQWRSISPEQERIQNSLGPEPRFWLGKCRYRLVSLRKEEHSTKSTQ